MQRMSYALSFSGKVSNAQFSRPDDTLAPVQMSYDYEREKAGDWDNLRIVPQLPPIGLADIDEKDPPVTPIQLGLPLVETDHAVMTLPKGWTANLPPSIHAKTSFASLTKTYKFENGVLTTDRELHIFQKNISASQWKAYHQWFKDAGLDGETYVQLNPASANGTPPPTPDTTEDNPEATSLVSQANQAETRRDWNGARALLDKARALNANQPYLWSNYAFLSLQDHDVTYAIVNLQKELSLHPSEAFVSRLLASVFMSEKKPDDAIAVLKTGIERSSTDETLILYLSSIYTQRGDYPSAEKVLRDGMTSIPASANIKMQLGDALLHEQKKDEAATLLRSVASTSDDPLQLNNTAYELADSSLDLPLAETTSRRGLSLLDQASNNGETGPNAIQRTALIVSSWDTYGWILYRDGKITEAEPWIRAAWRNGLSAEGGYHLAMILEKQHHLVEALNQLELASKGGRGTDPIAVQKLIDEETAKLSKIAHPTLKKDAAMQLQDERTYSLPRGTVKPTGLGWANVEVEVTAQGVATVRIVANDDSLQPLSNTIQHLNLNLQIPLASHARLVRRGILSCHENPTCQLVLVSAESN
jgi:tetratricopeptide (TPR) repeat protein